MSEDLKKTLAERGADYGEFSGFASVCQSLTDIARNSPGYACMDSTQREAVEMTLHKFARLFTGNPDLVDSWRDAAAYTTLGMNHTLGKMNAVDVKIVRSYVNRGQ